MAFRTRGRFRARRGRFGGRGVARKEPIWLTTAYNIQTPQAVFSRDFFQLIGPEDYTQDYLDDTQRRERCTLIRTVGGLNVIGHIDQGTAENFSQILWKAVLFIAGDEQIEESFAADPGQFDILAEGEFVDFCRIYSVLKVFWSEQYAVGKTAGATAPRWAVPNSHESVHKEWDVTVQRRLVTDQCLWLLVNTFGLNTGEIETGNTVEVESRCLIHD